MSFRPLIGVASVSIVVGCGGTPPKPSTPASFDDGEYNLVIDQRYRSGCASPQVPDAALPDSCFVPVTEAVIYPLRFTENARRVEILGAIEDGAAVRGSLDARAGADRVFVLEMFAGGQLRIRGTAAELTVFGSGVPIVKSERGQLTAR